MTDVLLPHAQVLTKPHSWRSEILRLIGRNWQSGVAGHPNGPAPEKAWPFAGLMVNLSLVFVLLLGIIALTVWLAFDAMSSLDRQLQSVSSKTLPASEAGYEMEINALESGMGVFKYMLRDDPALLKKFEEDRVEFRQFLKQFQSAASDPGISSGLKRAEELFEKYEAVGQNLINLRYEERASLKQLGEIEQTLEALFRQTLSSGVTPLPEHIDLVNAVDGTLALLGVYLDSGSPASLSLLDSAMADLKSSLSAAKTSERRLHLQDQIILVEKALPHLTEVISHYSRISTGIDSFIALRVQLDDLLDEEIQILNAQNLEETNRLARQNVNSSIERILLLSGIAVLVAAATIWLGLIGVIRPVRSMLAATEHFARGDLLYRAPANAPAEMGQLSRAMNQMADNLLLAQTRMANINEGLEAEVSRRTLQLKNANRDLEIAREAAEAANRAKSAFLANMSHELRTPLNAVIGFAQIMQDELLGPLGSEKYKSYAADINDSGTHLLSLLSGVLDIAQLDTGSLMISSEEVDVEAVLNDCAASIDAKANQRSLDCRLVIAGAVPSLRANRVRLTQVINNLVDNAVKFTNPGGWVRMSAGLADNGDLKITISDSGAGMYLEEIVRAFDVFGRADTSVAQPGSGAGIGLPLSKALTEQMGGRLVINSSPGAGTTVAIIFPASLLTDHAA